MSIEDRIFGSETTVPIYKETKKYPNGEFVITKEELIKRIKQYFGHEPGKRSVTVNVNEDGGFTLEISISRPDGLKEEFNYDTGVKPVDILRRAIHPDIYAYSQSESQFYDGVVSLEIDKNVKNGLCRVCLSNDFLERKGSRTVKKKIPEGVETYQVVTFLECGTCGSRYVASQPGRHVNENYEWTTHCYVKGVGNNNQARVQWSMSEFGLTVQKIGYTWASPMLVVSDTWDDKEEE